MDQAESFAEALDVLGVEYEFAHYAGDHMALPIDLSLPYLLDPDTTGCGVVVGVDDARPKANVTMRVLPNPSRTRSTFEFALPQSQSVSLIVHNVGGRLGRTVFEGALDAGPHSLSWDGKNEAGSSVADGVYFVTLTTGTGSEVVRTVRLK